MTTLAALSLHFPFVWYGFLLLFGLALGSFYNVVIYRLAAHVDPDRGRRADNPQHPGLFLPAVPPADRLAGQYPAAQFPLAGPSRPLLSRRPSRGAIR
ncbi:hypothetical protein LNP74_01300 [Klebsiella pneumoniae subsp. pneumoniae]|nr:hypothetical protein [Klebsiella pneumoniae subsp. pneumoniae]